jgi:hypothetical protein
MIETSYVKWRFRSEAPFFLLSDYNTQAQYTFTKKKNFGFAKEP